MFRRKVKYMEWKEYRRLKENRDHLLYKQKSVIECNKNSIQKDKISKGFVL